MANGIDDGGHAFPTQTDAGWAMAGMTLRDWFAGQALMGILSSFPEDASFGTAGSKRDLASDSYALADAMLAARDPMPPSNASQPIPLKEPK